jgi:Domain of unknown function (DUF4920)
MRRNLGVVCLIAIGVAQIGCAAKYASFGEPMKMTGAKPVQLAKVLSNRDAYNGKTLRVEGTVAEVCAKKGCWLSMKDGPSDETMFVKFTCPVDGRLIPQDAVGHKVIVEGTVTVEEITEDEARHYAEDRGSTPEEIASIVGPQKRVRMASPCARIEGISAG